LGIARELGDPALLARTLSACGYIAGARYDAESAAIYFTQAIDLARTLDDRWLLSQIRAWQANTALTTGDPVIACPAAEEGREIADAIGDLSNSRMCRQAIAWAHLLQGNVVGVISELSALAAECEEAHDEIFTPVSLMGLGIAHAQCGDVEAAKATAAVGLDIAADLGEYFVAMAYAQSSQASLAAGDIAAAHDAAEAAWERLRVAQPELAVAQRAFNSVEVALARGDLTTAREFADAAVAIAQGYHLTTALLVRARVATADGAYEDGERDAHEALACAASRGLYLYVPGIFECLAGLATRDGNHPLAARLFGAADALRRRMGLVRFRIYDAECEASLAILRNAMDEKMFDATWAEGAALDIEEAIAYAQRGRGERKRPASGWPSLTPAERDVAQLVCEGLANKEIATRLFVSPRTVQAHLSHVYAKLGITSRVQLVQEAARRP
jgi:DNA-binding CsgD family transcriptional regulator